MDNIILADNISLFSIFGWGFLAGSMTSCLVMLTFDWIKTMDLGRSKP